MGSRFLIHTAVRRVPLRPFAGGRFFFSVPDASGIHQSRSLVYSRGGFRRCSTRIIQDQANDQQASCRSYINRTSAAACCSYIVVSRPRCRQFCTTKSVHQDGERTARNDSQMQGRSNVGHGVEESLVLRLLGPRWSPYGRLIRIDKPAGALLLLLPCWWSIALAAPIGSWPDLKLMSLFGVGALAMRSAGCIINDLWDQDIDRQVVRTKGRPLASGEIGTTQALVFLGGQLTAGLAVLLNLNVECIKMGFAVMPLVVAYPLMKRFINWPAAFLGLSFNSGAFIGWTAVHGDISWQHTLPLYGAGICWTIVYDTLYGHQDKSGDAKLGLKSTALLFGSRTKPILAGFSVATIGLLGMAGHAANLSWPFYAGTAVAAGQMAWKVTAADLDNPEELFETFKSNTHFGAIVLGSIIAGHLM